MMGCVFDFRGVVWVEAGDGAESIEIIFMF